MNTQHVSTEQLVSIVEAKNTGAKIVGIHFHSDPKPLKKHRVTKAPTPYTQGIIKCQGVTLILGADYANGINREMDKAGENTYTIDPDIRPSFVQYLDAATGRDITSDPDLKHYLPTDATFTVEREVDEATGEPIPFQPGALWKGAGEHAGPYTVRHKVSGKLYFFGRVAGRGFNWSTWSVDGVAEMQYNQTRYVNLGVRKLLKTA